MNDKDYRAIRESIDAALQIMGDEPPNHGSELRIYKQLLKLRESVIRARRDSVKGQPGKPDSRSPLPA